MQALWIESCLHWNADVHVCLNSPVLQFGAPPAIDSGEAKICTASRENVNKHMARNTKLHLSMFQMT